MTDQVTRVTNEKFRVVILQPVRELHDIQLGDFVKLTIEKVSSDEDFVSLRDKLLQFSDILSNEDPELYRIFMLEVFDKDITELEINPSSSAVV